MRTIIMSAATVLLGTLSYVAIGMALASVG
jgi:hypothetical protein